MTPDDVNRERAGFMEHCPEFPQTKLQVFGDPQFMYSHTRCAERAWMKRAEIAIAREAEQQAEIERLRERVKELASARLFNELANAHKLMGGGSAKHMWDMKHPALLQLAEEAGVWFDDDGNEVPLADWKAMVGE